MSTTTTATTATTVNSNEWGYVSDESYELRSERSSEHQKIKYALSRVTFVTEDDLQVIFKIHLKYKFGNIKPVSFLLGKEEMTDENLHFLLMMLLSSYNKILIDISKLFTKLNNVYLDTKCGDTIGTFSQQITSAIDIFNTFLLTREFYEITNVCLYQNKDGDTVIVIGIKGYKPEIFVPDGYKLVYHRKRQKLYTTKTIEYSWMKSEYHLYDMVQIASSKKEEKKTETPAMDKPKTSVMKSGVAPLDACNRSETTDAISDTTQTTQTTTTEVIGQLKKSEATVMDFDTLIKIVKKSEYSIDQIERLQRVVGTKKTYLEAQKAMEDS